MVTRIDGDAIFGNMITVGAAETLAVDSFLGGTVRGPAQENGRGRGVNPNGCSRA